MPWAMICQSSIVHYRLPESLPAMCIAVQRPTGTDWCFSAVGHVSFHLRGSSSPSRQAMCQSIIVFQALRASGHCICIVFMPMSVSCYSERLPCSDLVAFEFVFLAAILAALRMFRLRSS